ncbi:hotdog fold thioesterase [Cryomorphaceae bacterium 1068]|nr:hotdog fold thioesterase [Cryomorphaceae bacterium 1068]
MDKTAILKKANEINKDTLMETLGIVFTDFGEDFVEATMPVNSRVHQPAGLLHGGATAALAESLGSLGSFIMVGNSAGGVVGIEINANHIRSIKSGLVTARGTLLHKGRKTHVWDIKVTDQDNRLISVCRLTNMILPK